MDSIIDVSTFYVRLDTRRWRRACGQSCLLPTPRAAFLVLQSRWIHSARARIHTTELSGPQNRAADDRRD
jgi:hypothetical protein